MTKPNIGVIGGGLMGHGIAYLFAAAGHEVGICELSAEVRAAIPDKVKAICELLDTDAALMSNISVHDQLAPAVGKAAFVFEAAPEKLGLKQQLFADMEAVVAPEAILTSNTSAIPITEIARNLKHRDRVVGAHFWNPPHLMPLVEVIQTEWSSPESIARTMAVLREAGRKPVHCQRDVPAFIGNRLQHALKREAIAMVADGICDAETIDDVVKVGFGTRLAVLGPLEQSDLVGLNLTLDIHDVLIADLDRTPGPHPLLKKLVAEGKLGMKTGEGFRKWTPQQAEAVRERLRVFLAGLAKRK